MATNPIAFAVARFRAQLASGQADAAASMLDSYAGILNRIEPNLRVIAAEIAKDGATTARLFEQKRLETILAQVADEVARYAAHVEPQIAARQRAAIDLARVHSRDLTKLALGPVPDDFTGPTWATVDARALENLVGLTADGAPFGDELRRLAGSAASRVKDALIRGTGTGQSAEQIAARAKDALGGHVGRFLTVARTAEMHAYTSSTMACFEENADVVSGWRWHSSLSFDTCLACLAMHGQVFPLGSPMERHFNCRCMAIPETKSWEELGFPGLNENKRPMMTGEEWLKSQPEDKQIRAFGKTRWELWKTGAVELDDFQGHGDYPSWGGMVFERSGKAALEAAKARKTPPNPVVSLPVAPSPKPKPKPKIAPVAPLAAPPPPVPSSTLSLPIVDTAFDNKLKGALKQKVAIGFDGINRVHRAEGLPTIPLKSTASRKLNGAYVFSSFGPAVEMRISLHGSHPGLTLCHEIGHFLDHRVLGTPGTFASESHPALEAWRKAVHASKAVRGLKNLKGQRSVGMNMGGVTFQVPINQSHLKYLLGNDELFARSYAQYIATRSNGAELKSQLAGIVGNKQDVYNGRQWEDKDFEPIAQAFDEIFRAKGWLI